MAEYTVFEGKYVTPLLVLKVNGRPPDLHSGKHINRWARARDTAMRRAFIKVMAQAERHRARMEPNAITNAGIFKPLPQKRRLHVTVWWRGVKRDDINLMQDLKADVDGLKDAGWIVDDNREWLVWDFPPEYLYAVNERAVGIEYRLFSVEG